MKPFTHDWFVTILIVPTEASCETGTVSLGGIKTKKLSARLRKSKRRPPAVIVYHTGTEPKEGGESGDM
jgi:hypothetical protein